MGVWWANPHHGSQTPHNAHKGITKTKGDKDLITPSNKKHHCLVTTGVSSCARIDPCVGDNAWSPGFSPDLGWFVRSGIPSRRSPVRNRRHSPTNAPGRRRTSVPRLAPEATVRASGRFRGRSHRGERHGPGGGHTVRTGRARFWPDRVSADQNWRTRGSGRGISPSTGREREGDARASPRGRE